jgi:hypothetical protein
MTRPRSSFTVMSVESVEWVAEGTSSTASEYTFFIAKWPRVHCKVMKLKALAPLSLLLWYKHVLDVMHNTRLCYKGQMEACGVPS